MVTYEDIFNEYIESGECKYFSLIDTIKKLERVNEKKVFFRLQDNKNICVVLEHDHYPEDDSFVQNDIRVSMEGLLCIWAENGDLGNTYELFVQKILPVD